MAIKVEVHVLDLTAEEDVALLKALDFEGSSPAGGWIRLAGPMGGGRRIKSVWDSEGFGGGRPHPPPACWQLEGISMQSPYDLHSNSTCLAPTAFTGCLRIRTPVPEMAGQSPRKRLGVSRHQTGGRAFLVIRAGPLD